MGLVLYRLSPIAYRLTRGDLFDVIELELVALLEVVEAVEAEAALVAGRDLARIVLEALQRGDGAIVDDGAGAQDAHPVVAERPAVEDVEPRRLDAVRQLEDLP